MQSIVILYPAFVMLLLIAAVSIGIKRYTSRSITDTADSEYLQLHPNPSLSHCFIKLTRNFDNLLELPILFITASLLIFAADKADQAFISLCWSYVILRYAHAFVFLTYNNLIHRRITFVSASVILLAIWIRLFSELAIT